MSANKVYVIAEAGVNHNGDVSKAFQLIDAAKEAGADAVKFQVFNAAQLTTVHAEMAAYQKQNCATHKNQQDMLKELQLSHQDFVGLKAYCDSLQIEFLATPFDRNSLAFLVDELNVTALKISSGDITFGPLLFDAARSGRDIILSTGLCSLAEIEDALSVIASCFIQPDVTPTREARHRALAHPAAFRILAEKISLLHCVSDYPARPSDMNLHAIHTLKQAFGLPVGLSDHSIGTSIPIASAALGISHIEKHFTLDRNLPGPDHRASLEPNELADMIKGIRNVEAALGNGRKVPQMSEFKNRELVRRSLVASATIEVNDIFSENNLVMKRPASGLSPMDYWDILGTRSTTRYTKEQTIHDA